MMLMAVLTLGAAAYAQTSQTTPNAKVQETLELLRDRDKTLHDFVAKVRKEYTNVRVGDKDIHSGTLAYKKDKNARKLGVHFDTFRGDDIPPTPLDEDMVFDGRYFIHRNPKDKLYQKFEMVPAGETFDPLSIGKGPWPFPIGQDPAEITREFTVTIEEVTAKNAPKDYAPADLVRLKLVPKPGGKYESRFKSSDLFVDPKLAMPVRIATVELDGNPNVVTLSDIKINSGESKILDVPPPPNGEGWTVENRPYEKK